MLRSQKGFTLLEILLVILIVMLIAAWVIPQYVRATERARLMEAVTLLENIAKAQQRKYMQSNRFVNQYTALDIAFEGASESLFYTKGNPATGIHGNGFGIELHGGPSYETGYADAVRHKDGRPLRYHYTVRRLYGNPNTTCIGGDDNGQSLCADFCGIDAPVPICCSNGTSEACAPADGTILQTP
ncbi:MAG: prepilin-type N-terminal cleavage/methylation domain-containing protein [Elusimicrobiaceae bacterium]|nr:prepilin-type N-terminal cleavage/methylation domain-containing protein [Elusimicrobiaceae bacterium]